jgi:hypothetical protein
MIPIFFFDFLDSGGETDLIDKNGISVFSYSATGGL